MREFDKSDSVSFRLSAASIEAKLKVRSFLRTLSCSAREHVRARLTAGARMRRTHACACACACVRSRRVASRVSHACIRRQTAMHAHTPAHVHNGILSGGRRRGAVCACARTLPRSYVVFYVHPPHTHMQRHACGGLCVGDPTKGGKPVSSGAPERREQPFYSIPGGKRLALS